MESLKQKTLTESEIADSLGYVVAVVQDVHKTWEEPTVRYDPYNTEDIIDYDNMQSREFSAEEGQYLSKSSIQSIFTDDITKAKWFSKPQQAANEAASINSAWNKMWKKAGVIESDIEIVAPMKAFVMLERFS